MMDDRQLSLHEAGHAVMCWYLGLPMTVATIADEGGGGHVGVDWPAPTSPRESVLVYMAGRMAEYIGGWDWNKPTANDEHGIRSSLDSRRLEGEDAQTALGRDWKYVGEVLWEHWRAVEAVAKALQERKTIPGAEVDRFILDALLQERYERSIQESNEEMRQWLAERRAQREAQASTDSGQEAGGGIPATETTEDE